MILVVLAWAAWCLLHSLLVAGRLRRAAERRLGAGARAYRLLYNLAALATFIPVVLIARSVDGPVVFHWWGAGPAVSALLFVSSMALFYAGARAYDMATFLGLRQIREGGGTGAGGGNTGLHATRGKAGLHATGGISRRGVLGMMRHPWYTAGILFLWTGPKNAAALATALILTLYLVVGAYLEEHRLRDEFGDEYRRYQGEVSMFLPLRWLRRAIRNASRRKP